MEPPARQQPPRRTPRTRRSPLQERRRAARRTAREQQRPRATAPARSDDEPIVARVSIAPTRKQTREQLRRRARRIESLKRKLRLAMGVLAIAAVAALSWILPRSHYFAVTDIAVRGASMVSDLQVRDEIDGLLEDSTVFTADIVAMRKRIEELPFVRSVTVTRKPPVGILIEIREYEPLAYAIVGNEGWLVARDGRILSKAALGAWADQVPVARLDRRSVRAGDRIGDEAAIRVLAAVPPTFPGSIDSVQRLESGLVVQLRSGARLVLGRDEDLQLKLQVAQRLMQLLPAEGLSQAAYLDVSVPARPALSP